MSENEAPQGNPTNSPSEEVRYDLNGNPIPSRAGGAPGPAPSTPVYAPPTSGYAAPPPSPGYGAPQSPHNAPPQGQYGYGTPGQPRPSAYAAPRGQGNFAAWLIVALVAALLIGGFAYFTAASKPQVIPVPTSFKSVKSGDGTFSVTGPSDWDTQVSGTSGSQFGSAVIFKKGPVSMEFDTNDALNSVSDVMRAGPTNGAGGNIDLGFGMSAKTRPAVEKIHLALEGDVAHNYSNYREQEMQTFSTSFGDSRISEFTANGGIFQGTIHGFRATSITAGKCVIMVCHCPEANWETMKPVFLKVMSSVVSENG